MPEVLEGALHLRRRVRGRLLQCVGESFAGLLADAALLSWDEEYPMSTKILLFKPNYQKTVLELNELTLSSLNYRKNVDPHGTPTLGK